MDELIPLSNKSLGALTVEHPRYDRSGLTPGIVHIGVGNFHRAHQAWYLHRLMQAGEAQDWAIIGAGVRPYDAVMRDKLLAQDCLTTLIELDPENTSAEVIGSMIDYLPVEEDNQALIRTMADPRIRIVAMTVTEGGYYIDPATKGFDASHPNIQHDAANPRTPCTAFGAMVEALRLRREAGHGPFTGQSCDNLQDNGNVLRKTVVSLARLSDPELADWIDQNASFPNSMVDCIAPAVGAAELAMAESMGIADAAPVTHEPYRQWVIEDDFCAGRPNWDQVGATFAKDVHAYETMKIRILNAAHTVIAEAGELLGVKTISECMEHPVLSAYFQKIELEEIAPTVAAVPEFTPQQYVSLIKQRFANSRIVDTTRRVAFDGSAKHPGFLLPILRDQMAAGRSFEGLALVEAIWARICEGTRADGSRIEPNDPNWEALQVQAILARNEPKSWLHMRQYYGDMVEEAPFAEAFERWLTLIWARGVEAAIATYCALPETNGQSGGSTKA